MKESHGYRNNPNETDQESAREIEELNQYWSNRFDQLRAENEDLTSFYNGLEQDNENLNDEINNLKAKLANRDLNLAHLTDLLDQIAEVAS